MQGQLEAAFLDAPSPSCTVTFLWCRSMTLGLFSQPLCPHCSEPLTLLLSHQLFCQWCQPHLELNVQKPFVMQPLSPYLPLSPSTPLFQDCLEGLNSLPPKCKHSFHSMLAFHTAALRIPAVLLSPRLSQALPAVHSSPELVQPSTQQGLPCEASSLCHAREASIRHSDATQFLELALIRKII